MAKSLRNSPWFFFVLCTGIFLSTFAGRLLAEDGDWQMWNDVQYSQTLGYGLDMVVRYEQRFEEDISEYSYYELEPMVYWRYSPRWDFALSYERDERLKPENEIDNLAAAVAVLKIPLKDWYLTNQFRTEWVVPEADENDWKTVYRNRTGLATVWKLGAKEFVPYLSEEFFYNIQDGTFTESRLQAGLGFPIVPHWMASVYFMRLDRRTADGWEWHPVVGIEVLARF